ncbi:MAG: hypothetical protein A2142_09475 [candidate division Zixibacteria bacterium RBG_16_48_11]|nr:MAG: hypothetical protein A2142_09475 [candidate division Zixibacteria bacterium RBG_16_48_11]
MGEAFTSIVDDASSVYYNPAGLALVPGREVMVSHVLYVADINYSFVALAFPVDKLGGTVGVAAYYMDIGQMDVVDQPFSIPPSSQEYFNPKEYAITISYARNLTDRLSIGITGKYIGENFGEGFFNTTTGATEDFVATGWAADVGTIYNTGFRGFKIGMIISNFGPDLNFNAGPSQEYPLPVNFKFGGSINLIQNHSHRALLAAELSHPNDNEEKYNLGLEYWYSEKFALRFGNQFKLDSYQGGISLGGGIRLPFNNQKTELRVDYAFRDYGILESAHRFSFAFAF